jgi:hypothetical protein
VKRKMFGLLSCEGVMRTRYRMDADSPKNRQEIFHQRDSLFFI